MQLDVFLDLAYHQDPDLHPRKYRCFSGSQVNDLLCRPPTYGSPGSVGSPGGAAKAGGAGGGDGTPTGGATPRTPTRGASSAPRRSFDHKEGSEKTDESVLRSGAVSPLEVGSGTSVRSEDDDRSVQAAAGAYADDREEPHAGRDARALAQGQVQSAGLRPTAEAVESRGPGGSGSGSGDADGVAICTPTPCMRQGSVTGKPSQTQVSRRLSLGLGGMSPPESECTFDDEDREEQRVAEVAAAPGGRHFGGVLQGDAGEPMGEQPLGAPDVRKPRPAVLAALPDEVAASAKENQPPMVAVDAQRPPKRTPARPRASA